MTNDVILINGLARSGKDTCASVMKKILKANGREAEIIHFYDPLKAAVDAMFGFDERHRDGELKETLVVIKTDIGRMAKAIRDTLLWEHSPYKDTASDWLTVKCLAAAFIDILSDDEDFVESLGDNHYEVSPRRLYQLYGTELMRHRFDQNIWVKFADKACELARENDKVTIISDLRFDNEVEFGKSVDGLIVKVVNPDADKPAVIGHVSENGIDESQVDVTIFNRHSSGLKTLEMKAVDVLDVYGFIPHFFRVVDFRKVDLDLLPKSVVLGRFNLACQQRNAIEIDLKSLSSRDYNSRYYARLIEELNEVNKIIKGLSTRI